MHGNYLSERQHEGSVYIEFHIQMHFSKDRIDNNIQYNNEKRLDLRDTVIASVQLYLLTIRMYKINNKSIEMLIKQFKHLRCQMSSKKISTEKHCFKQKNIKVKYVAKSFFNFKICANEHLWMQKLKSFNSVELNKFYKFWLLSHKTS